MYHIFLIIACLIGVLAALKYYDIKTTIWDIDEDRETALLWKLISAALGFIVLWLLIGIGKGSL